MTVAILALGKPQAIISKETASEMEANQEETQETPRLRTVTSKREKLPKNLSAADGNNTSMMININSYAY